MQDKEKNRKSIQTQHNIKQHITKWHKTTYNKKKHII